VAAIGGVYLIFLGRVLGAQQFGLYALVSAVATLAFASIDLRVHEATVKFTSEWKTKRDETARSVAALLIVDCLSRLGVWLLLVLSIPVVSRLLLHESGWNGLLLVAYSGLLLSKLGNNWALGTLRAFGLFDWHATVLLSSWMAKLFGTVVMFFTGTLDILSVLVMAYVCDVVANAMAVVRATRELRARRLLTSVRPVGFFGTPPAVRRFLFNGIGISLSDSLMRELDTTIVGWNLPLEAVGVYRMSKNLLLLAYRAMDPVCTVLMPEFARLAAIGNYSEIMRIGFRVTRILFLVTLTALVCGFALLPVLVPMLLGPQFSDVTRITLIMLVGLLVGGPLLWSYALWVAAGQMGMQLRANVLAAVCAGTLFLVLTPWLKVTGAAVAFAVTVSLPFLLSFLLWQFRSQRYRQKPSL
jgi:O-antigen/teichoic acid export membrane protein